jgi:hypothetical protein
MWKCEIWAIGQNKVGERRKCVIGGLIGQNKGRERRKCPIGGLYWTKQDVETV